MPKPLGLIAHHWLAKLLSLVLAVTLWAVIRRNVAGTTPPSRIDFKVQQPSPGDGFQIDTRIHAERKK